MKNTHPGKKGDIIKNAMKVSELPKKSIVIDNPNAVNVITASPAITKCKADTVVVPLQQPTAISTDSRPSGSVINGPIKLAFKTPAFKSNYNITRYVALRLLLDAVGGMVFANVVTCVAFHSVYCIFIFALTLCHCNVREYFFSYLALI